FLLCPLCLCSLSLCFFLLRNTFQHNAVPVKIRLLPIDFHISHRRFFIHDRTDRRRGNQFIGNILQERNTGKVRTDRKQRQHDGTERKRLLLFPQLPDLILRIPVAAGDLDVFCLKDHKEKQDKQNKDARTQQEQPGKPSASLFPFPFFLFAHISYLLLNISRTMVRYQFITSGPLLSTHISSVFPSYITVQPTKPLSSHTRNRKGKPHFRQQKGDGSPSVTDKRKGNSRIGDRIGDNGNVQYDLDGYMSHNS